MRITPSAVEFVRSCVAAAALAGLSIAAQAGPASERSCVVVDYNRMILEIIKGLPTGGGYSVDADIVRMPTITAHNIGGGNWEMRVYDGRPSYCTSATYAVFAHLTAMLHNGGRISLSPHQLEALAVKRTMPDGTARLDGEGLYGIFNSNGVGAGALLKHTGTGMSFRDDELAYARPGDFLKLFWNENVGATERGHQVIFTGRRQMAGRDMVCFWSSQKQRKKRRDGGTEALYFPAAEGRVVKDGYGEVCRPRSDIKAMIFSRVTCMEHLAAGLTQMRAKAIAANGTPVFVDDFLTSLSTKSSDHATLDRKYGILPAAAPAPVPATFADSGIAPLP